jgi:hypothetical protein
MSIEAALQALTAAVEANTAALKAGGGSAAAAPKADAKAAAPKAEAKVEKAAKSKYTLDQVKAAIVKVRETQGTPAAKAIIADAGKADKMDNIKPENFDGVIAACEAALAESDDDSADGDDDI